MLTPDYLQHVSDDIISLYQQLEDEIIKDIARRITKTNFATDTASWQMEKLQQAGTVYDDAIKQISKITGKSERELKKLFEDSATESLAFDDEVYRKAGLNPLPIKQSPAMLKILTSGLQKTNGSIKNLTLTTANTSQNAYIQACDLAYMQVSSGAFDYNTAIRNAIKAAAQQGLTVLYPTGHIDKLDVAIRRATLTGVSQTCGQLQIQRMDDMECDLVETTAHMGARESHAVWQGKVFSRSGKSKKYPDFVSSTGYGTGAGLMGWNCRHNFYPFFEGISERAYPDDELNDLADRKVTYNDKEYSDYEVSQTQRKFERSIRATKRELAATDAALKETDSKDLKNSLQADFTSSAVKLKRQEAAMRDFLEQTGRFEETARTQVLGFGKSISQKAVWAEKKQYEDIVKLVGKEKAPKTLDNFRKMKYNDTKGYNELTKQYKTAKSIEWQKEIIAETSRISSFRAFDNAEAIPQWIKDPALKWSEGEKEALNYYSSHEYSKINDHLRGKTTAGTSIQDKITFIASAIDKSNVEENIIVWRGTHIDNFTQSEWLKSTPISQWSNRIIDDKAFSSTAVLKEGAFTSQPVLMQILVPKDSKGAYIREISDFEHEYEMLLQSGTKYRILSAEENNGQIFIQVIMKE